MNTERIKKVTEKIKKVTERIEKDEGRMTLSLYMAEVIEELKDDRKHPAVHTYTSTYIYQYIAFLCGIFRRRHADE